MGIIKEDLNIDIVVENRPLTIEEQRQISEYIISQKKKNELKKMNIKRKTTESKEKV